MKVYLVRHGDAVSSDVDPERHLSEQGRAGVEKVASFIRPLGICVVNIWHSGKARAAQTAEIFAGSVASEKGCSAREGLKPNDAASTIAEEINAYDTDLMIVGHLPFMENLASLLLAGKETAEAVAFAAGAITCLQRRDHGSWQLHWMVSPKLVP
jgi:phosphohistidine phosphatase